MKFSKYSVLKTLQCFENNGKVNSLVPLIQHFLLSLIQKIHLIKLRDDAVSTHLTFSSVCQKRFNVFNHYNLYNVEVMNAFYDVCGLPSLIMSRESLKQKKLNNRIKCEQFRLCIVSANVRFNTFNHRTIIMW